MDLTGQLGEKRGVTGRGKHRGDAERRGGGGGMQGGNLRLTQREALASKTP